VTIFPYRLTRVVTYPNAGEHEILAEGGTLPPGPARGGGATSPVLGQGQITFNDFCPLSTTSGEIWLLSLTAKM
jgi:hypothetical protein